MSPTAGIERPSRPIPNEITSVAPSCPRYSRFSLLIAVRPTNATDSIASLTRSDSSVFFTRDRTRDAAIPGRRTVDETSTTIRSRPTRSVACVFSVRLDDLTHETMPHYIGLGEVVESNTVYSGQYSLDLHET